MRVRSLRGQLTDTNVHRIIVDDGRATHGYIVREFYVWTTGASADGVYAVLGNQYDMTAGGNASDNRQIAWAGGAWGTAAPPASQAFQVVDPDHVIVRDLFIQRVNTNDTANYLIVLEPRTLSEDQAIMALIKERSQDDSR